MRIFDSKFKKNPRPYIIQSLLALGVFFLVLVVVEQVTQVTIIAALGASTFIVFAMPHYITAQPRRLVGGHIMGLISGSFCHFIGNLHVFNSDYSTIVSAFIFAAALGLAMFLMVITNTEHPPAAATAIGILMAGLTWGTLLYVLLFAVLLAGIHIALRRYLVNLF